MSLITMSQELTGRVPNLDIDLAVTMIREAWLDIRKLSKKVFSRFTVGRIGCFGSIKTSKVYLFPFMNVSLPSTIIPSFAYSPISACIVLLLVAVGAILMRSSNSYIVAAIVETLMVYVVNLALVALLQSQQETMHPDHGSLRFNIVEPSPANRVIDAIMRIEPSSPSPLGKPFEIAGVNNGNLVMVKMDHAIRLFKWKSHARSNQRVGLSGASTPDSSIIAREALCLS